jgi:CBS domain-containing protein
MAKQLLWTPGPSVATSPKAIQEAAHRMVEKQIGCLPVTEKERLIGMVTETDILREGAKT